MRVFLDITYNEEEGRDAVIGFDFDGYTELVSEGNSEFSREYEEFTVTDIDMENAVIKSKVSEEQEKQIRDYIAKNKEELEGEITSYIYNHESWR